MMMRIFAAAIAAAALTGCVRLDMPPPASESWTLARIAETEGGAAPVYVPERRLTREELAAFSASERAVLARGAQVRAAAVAVKDPDEDADSYAARQLARATPPE